MAVIKIVPMPGAKGDKGDDGATGAQGPQGPIGATGPAGADAAWYYNGAYNPGASYVVGDVVTYDGQTWYRKNANGGNVGDTPSEGLFWDLIAAKGEQGLTGLEGEQGPQGEVGPQGPQGEPGTPGSLLNYWDGLSTPVPLPAEDGLVVIDGIVSSGGRNILVSADDRVFIGGNNGEFLNGLSTPENQIATIGDIENAISQSGSLTYKSGAVPATHHGVAGDTKNDIKYDDTHMYICVADYTDGSAVIWKRINWASGNW